MSCSCEFWKTRGVCMVERRPDGSLGLRLTSLTPPRYPPSLPEVRGELPPWLYCDPPIVDWRGSMITRGPPLPSAGPAPPVAVVEETSPKSFSAPHTYMSDSFIHLFVFKANYFNNCCHDNRSSIVTRIWFLRKRRGFYYLFPVIAQQFIENKTVSLRCWDSRSSQFWFKKMMSGAKRCVLGGGAL